MFEQAAPIPEQPEKSGAELIIEHINASNLEADAKAVLLSWVDSYASTYPDEIAKIKPESLIVFEDVNKAGQRRAAFVDTAQNFGFWNLVEYSTEEPVTLVGSSITPSEIDRSKWQSGVITAEEIEDVKAAYGMIPSRAERQEADRADRAKFGFEPLQPNSDRSLFGKDDPSKTAESNPDHTV